MRDTEFELLAPARDLACGVVAINCGADAVYIGAPKFSARAEARNTVEDIRQLADYAHLFGSRVYVALNTVLFDDEIPAAVTLVEEVYEAGVDGLIIQDMGLLEADLPPIPLIASTQTHNATVEKVRFLENLGFKRAILARELSLQTIAQIRAGTDHIELECFVHGALCVSYSGRCSMSHAIGGRSGNRGVCAQPCRHEYQLLDGDDKVRFRGQILSVKDMNRAPFLSELVDAGVTSFKIEGRLKDASYVANTVSYYRAALDDVLSRRAGFSVEMREERHLFEIPFVPDLRQGFNRGSIDFGMRGHRNMQPILNRAPPGELLGTVLSAKGGRIVVSTSHLIVAGDGLCWRNRDGGVSGSRVQSCDQGVIVLLGPDFPSAGTEVHRSLNKTFQKAALKAAPVRRIPVKVVASMNAQHHLVVTIADFGGHTGLAESESPVDDARDVDKAREGLIRSLERMGDSVFVCRGVSLEFESPPFVPLSVMNGLRRLAISRLEERRRQSWQRPIRSRPETFPVLENKVVGPEENVTNQLARKLYERCGATSVEMAVEVVSGKGKQRVMRSIHCVRRELGTCLRTSSGSQMPGPLSIVDERGRHFDLTFDCDACEMSVWYGKGDDGPRL